MRQTVSLPFSVGAGKYAPGLSMDIKMSNWSVVPTPNGRTATMLVSMPGSRDAIPVPNPSGCRGLFTASTGPASTGYGETLYGVFGDSLYRLSRDGTATRVGTGLFDSGNDISFAQNQDQTEGATYGFVCDGRAVYKWDLKAENATVHDSMTSAGTLPFVNGTSSTYAVAAYITYCQYRLVVTCANSVQWFFSEQNASDFSSAAFESSESNADKTVRVMQHAGALYVFSRYSYDIFNPTNSATDPWACPPGNSGKVGLASGDSLAQIGDYMLWLGQGPTSDSAVFMSDAAGSLSRVSTPGIETFLREWAYKGTAKGLTWSENGLTYYALTSKGDQMTVVYCLETKLWHTRSTSGTGVEKHWEIAHATNAYGKVYMGTASASTIIVQDALICTDNMGLPITRIYQTPVMIQDCDFFKLQECRLDVDVGVGSSVLEGVEHIPEIWVQFCWDGVWSGRIPRPLGRLGAYGTQVAWHGCGGGRNLVVRIGTSAPFPLNMYQIRLSVEKAGRT